MKQKVPFYYIFHIYVLVLIILLYLCNNTPVSWHTALTRTITNHTLYRRYETGNYYFEKLRKRTGYGIGRM